MLETGIKGRQEVVVSDANSAKTMGSGTLDVFATPAMTALMEKTAWMSVADQLDEGCGTVEAATSALLSRTKSSRRKRTRRHLLNNFLSPAISKFGGRQLSFLFHKYSSDVQFVLIWFF